MGITTMKLRLFLLFLIFLTSSSTISTRLTIIPKTYTAHMDNSVMPTSFNHHFDWYHSILTSITPSPHILYRFDTVIDGFSVALTPHEAEALANKPGVLSVIRDRVYRLHTTRTPQFLGLVHPRKAPFVTSNTDQLVVGLLDSGIWPEHKSFDDTGLGPVPSTWKGSCDNAGFNFTASSCNNKLIGARYFCEGLERAGATIKWKSARDYQGHGTHTSSTAAGSVVGNASLFGLASGEARGMAPNARISAYKVCWGEVGYCITSDILAGIEAAIKDGVNVLSMSLGGGNEEYYDDLIAIAAYGAMRNGIFFASSAGNGGPRTESVVNIAPWMTAVGASTLDREILANVTLGNGNNYTGVSLFNEETFTEYSPAPLVYNGVCQTQDPELVKGKVVVCDQTGPLGGVIASMDVKEAGGVGLILINTIGDEVFPAAFFLPTAAVGKKTGKEIKNYMESDPNATATVYRATTKVDVKPAPLVASFSSRGPNSITPEILKPDLIAPGVSIVAAWTPYQGPTSSSFDTRNISFNIEMGTSMSCPHVSGLALLLKGAHLDWSPAAIRSALMTTAYTTDNSGKPITGKDANGRPMTSFDYGSGHVDPMAALDPGLVYNATEDDYLGFLCALNYSSSEIKIVTKRTFTCDPSKEYSLGDFNYPSFSVVLGPASNRATYRRTLTNVGEPSTYRVTVSLKKYVNVTVEPSILTFSEVNEENSYTVTFVNLQPLEYGTTIFGSLEWSNGKHKVRSPIVVTKK